MSSFNIIPEELTEITGQSSLVEKYRREMKADILKKSGKPILALQSETCHILRNKDKEDQFCCACGDFQSPEKPEELNGKWVQ